MRCKRSEKRGREEVSLLAKDIKGFGGALLNTAEAKTSLYWAIMNGMTCNQT
jgi:hypothetical protein